MDVTITLTTDQVELLIEALDSHEYWQVGQGLPRNEGAIFIPGDYLGADDPHWTVEPTAEDWRAIESVRLCRRLAQRLQEEVRAEGKS